MASHYIRKGEVRIPLTWGEVKMIQQECGRSGGRSPTKETILADPKRLKEVSLTLRKEEVTS